MPSLDLLSLLVLTIGVVVGAIGVWVGYTGRKKDDKIEELNKDLKRRIKEAEEAKARGAREAAEGVLRKEAIKELRVKRDALSDTFASVKLARELLGLYGKAKEMGIFDDEENNEDE